MNNLSMDHKNPVQDEGLKNKKEAEVVFTIKMTKEEYMEYISAKLKKKGF